MSQADLIWQKVTKRAPPARRSEIPKLQKYLSKLDNPHACLLCGRTTIAPCDQSSALALEAWVVAQYQDTKVSKVRLADWLRLIFEAIREFNLQGKSMFPTRLADVVRPQSSPFAVGSMDKQRRVEPWRKAMYQWLQEPDDQKTNSEWLAAIAVSAVLHGALLDSTKIKQFVAKLVKRQSPIFERGSTSVLFHLPYQGLGNHNLQRWFIDPLTEMLVWRYLKLPQTDSINDLKIDGLIRDFFAKRIDLASFRPKGLPDFLESARVWWAQRASPIDLHCASRALSSHAINERSWARLGNLPFTSGPSVERLKKRATPQSNRDNMVDDIFVLHPWLQEAIQILKDERQDLVQPAIAKLLAQVQDDPTGQIYLQWLHDMLGGISSSKTRLATSTIRRRFEEAAPRLIGLMGDSSPADMTTLELEDYYAELIILLDPLEPVKTIADGVRDFHAYMHRTHKKPLMKKESDVLGDENALKPVDANILSFDEYAKAQAWLDSQRAPKMEIQAAKIVLMMAFKLGLRRMEIFGLRRKDVQLSRYPTCLIRKNELRRLKTDNAKRTLPLFAFLSKNESELLAQWMQSSQLNPHSGDPDFLFPEFGGENAEAWIYRISNLVLPALRSTTGDDSLFMHHLRHSFGTWAYLRLRAPEFPDITRHFSHLPATVFALKTGRRLRVLLFGRDTGVSRMYPAAVARLLGHSTPVVSFAHYVHSSEFIMAAIARRECQHLPPEAFLGASGLKKSASYEHRSESVADLLAASRSMYLPAEIKHPPALAPKRRRGRPAIPAAHQRNNWISFARIEEVLKLSIDEHLAFSDIVKETGILEEKVRTILIRATKFGQSIGIACDGLGVLTQVPLRTHRKSGADFCKKLEHRLADMTNRAPLLLAQGLQVYLNHYDLDKKDTVLKGVKDLADARTLMRFLESLGCAESEFTFVVRSVAGEQAALPAWIAKLGTRWKPAALKIIRPKSESGAASYAQWIGILPVDSGATSIGLPVAKTVFLASLIAADT
jgi:integrase